MASSLSEGMRGRDAWRGGVLYLIFALAVVAIVVFLLFRGRSRGPKATSAEDAPARQGAVNPIADLAAAPERLQEPTAAQATQPVLPPPVEGQSARVPSPVLGTLNQTNPETEAVIAEAMALVRAQPGQVIEARNQLNRVLEMPLMLEQREAVKNEMAKLASEWLFGPAAFAGDTLCDTYVVRRGDLLDVIRRRFKVPYEFLMQINAIPRPQALQAGRALKIVKGPFHGRIYRSQFVLDLYLQDTYVRSFKVGLGKPGYETPVGLWRVQENGKLIKPTWTDPDTGRVYEGSDPDYPLGSRWIALDGVSGAAKGRKGFAIHGTKDPKQIGTVGSRGCIRIHDEDVVLVYNLLVPVYSQVEVVN
jgi:LysM repeat protein